MRKLFVLATVAALTLSACAKTNAVKDPDEGSANTVSVKAHEYMFDVSGTAKTGQVSFAFSNTGKELHHAILGRIDEGKTLADVKAEIDKQEEGPPPEWFHDEPIDSNVIAPGRSATISFPLTDAGTYVLLCFMPSADGTPHVSKGMYTSFEVEGAGDAKAPTADATVQMTEYAFTAPKVDAGTVTLEFKNAGKENHEFIVVKFAEGKTSADVDAWFEGGLQGEPPAQFYGGSHDFEPGLSVFFTVDLDPGTYTLVCGVETDDGKNHADDLGMMTEFTVA